MRVGDLRLYRDYDMEVQVYLVESKNSGRRNASVKAKSLTSKHTWYWTMGHDLQSDPILTEPEEWTE